MPNDFARILHAGTLPGLGVVIPADGGFKEWVARGAYDPDISVNGNLLLNRVDLEDFTRAVSFDYARFALASHESRVVALSERKQFGSVGWPLLKQYYSAFFASHAVMIARGSGIIRIDSEKSKIINSITQSYLLNAPRLTPGTYLYSLTRENGGSFNEVRIEISATKNGKGVHEAFWNMFVKFIE